MPSLIYKPPPGGNMEAIEVRLPVSGGMVLTFSPGVPTEVQPELLSAVQTELQTMGGTLASTATPTVTLVGPGGTGAYSYEVVTVDADGDAVPSSAASPPAALSAPATPTTTVHTPGVSNLTAGNYQAVATFTNAQGETTASSANVAATLLAGDTVTFTVASVPAGAVTVRFYLTVASGGSVALGFIGAATPSGGSAHVDLLTRTQGDTTTAPVSNTTGPPAALSVSSYCHIAWTAPSDPTSAITGYKVLRTVGGATQGLIASVAANVTSYNDQGGAATAYSAAVSNPGLIGAPQGPVEI